MSADENPADTAESRAIQKAAAPPSQGPQPSMFQPELFQKFLQNQSEEIAVRAEEIALEKKRIETTHEFSNHSLDVQLQDRRDDRQHKKEARRDRLIFALIALLLLVGLIVYAVYRDKDALAAEIVKAIIYLSAGALGGFGIARGVKSLGNVAEVTEE